MKYWNPGTKEGVTFTPAEKLTTGISYCMGD